jgi:hypothetical protein
MRGDSAPDKARLVGKKPQNYFKIKLLRIRNAQTSVHLKLQISTDSNGTRLNVRHNSYPKINICPDQI